MKETEFDSFQEFRDAGAAGYMYMPERATDQQYYLNYTGLSLHSIYSFRLEDQEEYDDYIEHIKNYSSTEQDATSSDEDWYSKYESTEEQEKVPDNMPFEKVIPDEIESYTILYYKLTDSGTTSEGILVNETTKRFVVYYLSSVR